MTPPAAAGTEPLQLRSLLEQALEQVQRAATLEGCADVVRQLPQRYHGQCRLLLIGKAVESYGRSSLEEVLESPVVREFNLNTEEIKKQIRQFYLPQMLEAFSQTQAAYSAIRALEPSQAQQQYQLIFGNIEAIDSRRQRFQEDFGYRTILFGNKASSQNFEQGLHQLAIDVTAQYLHFLIQKLPNRELATDDFNKKYEQQLARINVYKETANLSEDGQESLELFLDEVDNQYQQYRTKVKPEIEEEREYWRKLSVLTRAHGDQFRGDGKELFKRTFAQLYHLCRKYSRLLGIDEQELNEISERIKQEAQLLRIRDLPKI